MGFLTRKMEGFFIAIWLLLVFETSHCHSKCSWEYGAQPCSKYVPAPPGKTPPCARPGLTYCEYPENYPRWQFNHQSLIIDESKEEFYSVLSHPHGTYGPPAAVTQNTIVNIKSDGYHYDKPQGPGLTYGPPSSTKLHSNYQNFSISPNNPFLKGYQDRYPNDGFFQTYKYTASIPSSHQEANLGQHGSMGYNPYYQTIPATAAAQGYYNDVWKRNERYNKTLRRKRALQLRQKYPDYPNVTEDENIKIRKKRQTQVQGQTLCRSRTNFVTPRAALNSQGNWMYVVNMPELDNRYTQQVKSETCIDRTCSNLCGLPQGYASTCEQKYVQKRLVALDGGGSDLYTDTFWFPSCCICTISNT